MKKYRITITPRTGNLVSFRTDEFEDGRYKLFDTCVIDTQLASSVLVFEKEKASNGVYELEIVDNREKFVMV